MSSTVSHSDRRGPGGVPSGPSHSVAASLHEPKRRSFLPKTCPAFFALVAVLAGCFWYLNCWPLWHTDLWGHLAYGRLIWQNGQIPDTEPFMPLARGETVIDTAWLAQVVAYVAQSSFGEPAMHFLFAALTTASLATLAWAIERRTQRFWFTLAGLAIFVAVSWEHLKIIRPQIAGVACFVVLFSLLTLRRWSRANWVIVPLLFAIWANLHGSFLVGLAAIGCCCAGRAADVARRSHNFAAPIRDKQFRRLFFLFVLAALAVLANPYGDKLYAEVIAVSSHDNLSGLVEWGPLTLRMRQGRTFTAVVLGLIVVYRMTPRRISWTEVLMLVTFGGATLWMSRMIIWFAPVAAYYFALHASAIWKWRGGKLATRRAASYSLLWTYAAIGVSGLSIALTPLAGRVLFGSEPNSPQNLSPHTPVGATAYLREHPSRGQLFNTYEWGDYLVWAGPPNLPVFVTSHAHLVPESVWRDYIDVINVRDGWRETLSRYDVQTVVLDKRQHERFTDALRTEPGWSKAYEDEIGAIFVRRE